MSSRAFVFNNTTSGKKTQSQMYRKPATRFNKRWYVDASIPKQLPFIGGASFKAGSGTLSKREIQSYIRNTVLENKQKIFIDSGHGAATHNTMYTWNPLSNIPIGTGDASRLSDNIHVKSIRARVQFQSISANQSVIRFIWLKSNAEYGSGSDTFVSGLGSSQVFLNGTSQLGQAVVDLDKVTVLKDVTYRVDTGVSDSIVGGSFKGQQVVDISCPLPASGMKMVYNSATSNYARDKNLYLIVLTWSFGATSGVTQLAGFALDAVVNFVDGQ